MSKEVPKKITQVRLVYENKIKAADRPQVSGSGDAHTILRYNWSDQIGMLEEFNVLFLDRSNRVMAMSNISKGGINGTVVDLRVVFATALKARSSSLILAHNHPSGNLNPSQADINLTRDFQEAGNILKINIIDHIILSPDGEYYSFADEHLIYSG